jgi:hypothetical protein
MTARKWITALALVGTVAAAHAGDGIVLSHYEPLESVSLAPRLDAPAVPTGAEAGRIGPSLLSFDALGRRFELQLEPHAGLIGAVPNRAAGAAIPYRGRLVGVADSWARIVITDGIPAGLVWDGTDYYALEAPGDSLVGSGGPIAYRLSDAIIEPGALACASGPVAATGSSAFQSVTQNLAQTAQLGDGATSEIIVGAVADYEFTQAVGSGAEAAILTRLSIVDGIFSEQLGVQISVPAVETFTEPDDPFGDSTDPQTLLDDVRAYRVSSQERLSPGLTHLYTGRTLNNNTVGIAFTGVLCSNGFGVGLSTGGSSLGSTFEALVAAHEIGHNFGAPHDGEEGSPCVDTPQTFLMAPTINQSQEFSQCSIQEMQDDIAAAMGACITALPSTDIAATFASQTATVLLSARAVITVDIVNNGTELAESVTADVTLPAELAFVSAASAAAGCMSGAGTVSCDFGDVQGGAAATIDITVDAVATGTGSLDVNVAAVADDRLANNSDTLLLTVDPAVDLVVNAPAAAEVTLNSSTTISATLENRSPLQATGVTLAIDLAAGLEATAASWSIGSCTVAAARVDCQANAFAGQSNSDFSLTVRGVSSGTRTVTYSLGSAEAEANAADNSANGTVNVNMPVSSGSSGGGGGGGSLGWPLVWLLAGAAVLGRRRNA